MDYIPIPRLALPQFLGGLITYYTPSSDAGALAIVSTETARLHAVGLVVCLLIMTVPMQSVWLHFFRLGMRLRLTSTALIYRKALRIATCVQPPGHAGHVLNLMATDVTRFNTALVLIHDLWRGPVELMLMGWAIYAEIGLCTLLGVAVLLATLPLLAWASQLTAVYRKRSAKHADDRMHIVGEILHALQVIKMYTWERWFAKRVDDIRK